MKLLLDTNIFIVSILAPEELSPQLAALLLDASVERSVSVVSLWEIAVKVQIGKLDLPLEESFYRRHLQALQARVLPVEMSHSLALFQVPQIHKDPFDRLLVAQARSEGMIIATRDAILARYPVETIY